jgi:hypothetical protein
LVRSPWQAIRRGDDRSRRPSFPAHKRTLVGPFVVLFQEKSAGALTIGVVHVKDADDFRRLISPLGRRDGNYNWP